MCIRNQGVAVLLYLQQQETAEITLSLRPRLGTSHDACSDEQNVIDARYPWSLTVDLYQYSSSIALLAKHVTVCHSRHVAHTAPRVASGGIWHLFC